MSGKPGRPPEDRLKRQHEIFLAVAPLIERHGAKRLTMRQAARAAHLSLGGLYHYFPTKGDLVLHALKPEAVARLCAEFMVATPTWSVSTPAAMRLPGTTSRPVSKAAWSHVPDRWPMRCPSAPLRRSAALAAACGAPSSRRSSTAP